MSDYQPAPDETQLPLFGDIPVQSVTQAESRQAGRAASLAAMPRADSLRDDQLAVLDIIKRSGQRGATSSEISAQLGKPKNCFSGRITELVQGGFIYRREGVRRGRDAVLFARG